MAKRVTPEQARAKLTAHAKWLRGALASPMTHLAPKLESPSFWPEQFNYIATAIERFLSGEAKSLDHALGLVRSEGAQERNGVAIERARLVFPYILDGLSIAKAFDELVGKASEWNGTPRTAAYYNDLLAPALSGERHDKVAKLLGHVLSISPQPAVLLCLVVSHVRLTYPDLTDFDDKEIEKIARAIMHGETKKMEAA